MIACWNGKELLEKNLPSVIKASENPRNKIEEILIVDDGSTDGSMNYLQTAYSRQLTATKSGELLIRIIRHKKNLGYSATCNTGVQEAKGDLVAILNLDVIPSLNFLEFALPNFEEEKTFAVSFNEGKFGPGKIKWEKGFLEIKTTIVSGQAELADWASGGSSLFRKSIWEEIGGMDEIFSPFYFEDIDLGLRAKKKGFLCLWEPGSRVEHKHEATINKDNFDPRYISSIKERNHLLVTWRNIDTYQKAFSHLFYLGKRCLFKPGYLKIVFLAFLRVV